MVCIYCGSATQVTNSRHQKRANFVWRRRKCLNCQAVTTSIEKADLITSIVVTKKDGRIEPFYEEKLFVSVLKSLEHRQNYTVNARSLTDTAIAKLTQQIKKPQLTTSDIAQVVSDVLKHYDLAALVKYSSFQRQLSAQRDIKKLTKNS
jgi:transcriptional regulator NrdR family protein